LWGVSKVECYWNEMCGGHVTRQRVTEQAFYDYVICVNAKIVDKGFRVDPAASFIDESGGFFFFWKKVSVGCAWDAWKGY
jgi:hypothetical protein